MNLTLWLLVAAVLVNGLLVGASLDQTIKQLPARRRIGPVAFSEYSKAGDLSNGVAWYATLGVGAAVLTVIAALAGLIDRPSGRYRPPSGRRCCSRSRIPSPPPGQHRSTSASEPQPVTPRAWR